MNNSYLRISPESKINREDWGNDLMDADTALQSEFPGDAKSSAFLSSELRHPSVQNIMANMAYRRKLVEDISKMSDEVRYAFWQMLHSMPANERYGFLVIYSSTVKLILDQTPDGIFKGNQLVQEHKEGISACV